MLAARKARVYFFSQGVALDKSTILQWEATQPRMFMQHKSALMRKKEHTKSCGKERLSGSGESWGREGEYDQTNQILKDLIELLTKKL